MYIVIQGTLRVLSGSDPRDGPSIAAFSASKRMEIIEEHMPRSTTVIAGTYCELGEIEVPRFLALVASKPALSIAVLRVISRRLRVTDRRHRG